MHVPFFICLLRKLRKTPDLGFITVRVESISPDDFNESHPGSRVDPELHSVLALADSVNSNALPFMFPPLSLD